MAVYKARREAPEGTTPADAWVLGFSLQSRENKHLLLEAPACGSLGTRIRQGTGRT